MGLLVLNGQAMAVTLPLSDEIDSSVSLTQEEKTLFWKSNQELWEDIGYFLENKELRRPEFWLNRPE
ncbi:hypothetical protein PJ764_002384 [Klebsiella oxytoca]|nr:hypothetical protein [Klebsiella oxytoca]